MLRLAIGTVLGVTLAMSINPEAQAQMRILYLSKSAGFEHEAVKRQDGKPSISERVLTKLAEEHGAEIKCTKDASLINAQNLKNYDLVIFYTTGILTEPGTDKQPPMGPNGLNELINWVKNGGGFIGLHAATDTWGTPANEPPNEYTQFIGATFAGHGAQFEGTVQVVDPTHPAMRGLPKVWSVKEEWYTFRHFDKDHLHVLALMDPGAERGKQKTYDIPAYPIIWCKTLGKGRIHYNALGHRDEVWNDPTYQAMLVDAARWATGNGPADAAPNFAEVVPKEVPAR